MTRQCFNYYCNNTAAGAVPSLVTSSNDLLPGKPLDYSLTNVSVKESDTESVNITMVTKEEDSDLEFFDALDNSNKVMPSSPVTMTEDKVNMIRVKDNGSLINYSLSKISSLSNAELPTSPDDSKQQLNVSLTVSMVTLLHGIHIQTT